MGNARVMWASLPLLLWHQTEEWVLPSGFLPWFNRSVWASGHDEFPVTPAMAFRINVIAGWGVSAIAAITVTRAPFLASSVLSSHAANGGLHLARAIQERRYNPGLATAMVMAPLGLYGTVSLVTDPAARRRGALLGAGVGLAASAVLPLSMRRRVRTARPESSI
jgi:Protein of unknown function with HXXEE motif